MPAPYEPFPSGNVNQEVTILPPYGGPFMLPRKPAPERYTDREIGAAVARYVNPCIDKRGDVIDVHSTPDGGRFRYRVVRADFGKVEIEDLDTGERFEADP